MITGNYVCRLWRYEIIADTLEDVKELFGVVASFGQDATIQSGDMRKCIITIEEDRAKEFEERIGL